MEGRAVEGGAALALPPDLMAMRVAALLRDGEYVNLGIGLPTLVSNYIAGRGVTLHSENGILGYGAFPAEGDEDLDLYNASGQLVTPLPETSYFDSTTSFAMARTGRVSTIVLGAFQVAPNGDLANWNIPSTGAGGIGGAMDLAAGGGRIIAMLLPAREERRLEAGAAPHLPADRARLRAPRGHRPGVLRHRRRRLPAARARAGPERRRHPQRHGGRRSASPAI